MPHSVGSIRWKRNAINLNRSQVLFILKCREQLTADSGRQMGSLIMVELWDPFGRRAFAWYSPHTKCCAVLVRQIAITGVSFYFRAKLLWEPFFFWMRNDDSEDSCVRFMLDSFGLLSALLSYFPWSLRSNKVRFQNLNQIISKVFFFGKFFFLCCISLVVYYNCWEPGLPR